MWDSMFPLLFQQKNLLTQVNVGTIIFVKVLYDLQKKTPYRDYYFYADLKNLPSWFLFPKSLDYC